MSKQTQTTTTATASKTQQKPVPIRKQRMVPAPEQDITRGLTDTTTYQSQSQRLGNLDLPRIQRQVIAEQMGQEKGNRYLQSSVRSEYSNHMTTGVVIQRQGNKRGGAAPQRLDIPQDQILARAVDLYKTSFPIEVPGGAWGNIRLYPGQSFIWPNGKERVIISPTPWGIVFAEGKSLYTQPSWAFVRSWQLDALSVGAGKAEGMARLAKLEMELIMAMGPRWAMMGVSLVKGLVWLDKNYTKLKNLAKWSGTLLTIRQVMKEKFPHTYHFIWNQMLLTAVQNVDFEFNASDYAKLIGGLLRVDNSGELKLAAKTLWQITKTIATKVAVTVGKGVARGTASGMKNKAAALIEAAEQVGIAISKRDARQLAHELSKPDTIEMLIRLQQAFHAIAQDLEALATES